MYINSLSYLSAIRYILSFVCLSVCICACQSQKEKETSKPNIIYIMADDMGFSDIGCYGSEINTPVLDNLASGGIRFTNFYNAARCCPSRAALLTGQYPHVAGVGKMITTPDQEITTGPYRGFLSEETPTIAEMLRQAGYGTYMSGKWHVGERKEHWPLQRGFDKYFGLISGASSYFELVPEPRPRAMALQNEEWFPPKEGFYMTDATTDYALEFLDEHHSESPEKPFFLYLAYTAPHWPIHAPDEEIEKYLGKYTDGWDVLREQRFAKLKSLGLLTDKHILSERNDNVPAWTEVDNKEEWDRKMAVYAAMIDRMDQGIGKLTDFLKKNNLYDNTLIVFISDNGGCEENVAGRKLNDPTKPIGTRGSYVAYDEPWANASNTPFRKYKRYIHEGGIITPAIVHWPAGLKSKGTIHREPAHIIDLLPTALELAEVSPANNPSLPGVSFIPMLQGEGANPERAFYWEHYGNKAIRKGDWKLVMESKVGEWELYNLATDPVEIQDLVEEMPALKDSLKAEWEAWALEVGV